MKTQSAMMNVTDIPSAIHLFRGQRVLLDSDLAIIYGVSTTRLNEQLRRNLARFPQDFAFQLTSKEFGQLKQALGDSGRYGGRRTLPYVFTEHGAIMLASILNSPVAIEASVRVVRAFVHLREMLASNRQLAAKFAELERRLDGHDESLKKLFDAIRRILNPDTPPKSTREIGFHVHEAPVRYRTRQQKSTVGI
jgi:hypothetical protein